MDLRGDFDHSPFNLSQLAKFGSASRVGYAPRGLYLQKNGHTAPVTRVCPDYKPVNIISQVIKNREIFYRAVVPLFIKYDTKEVKVCLKLHLERTWTMQESRAKCTGQRMTLRAASGSSCRTFEWPSFTTLEMIRDERPTPYGTSATLKPMAHQAQAALCSAQLIIELS